MRGFQSDRGLELGRVIATLPHKCEATSGSVRLPPQGPAKIPGSRASTFNRPLVTGLKADMSPPMVESVSCDPQEALLAGTALDDQSLKRLSAYEGPHPLATTDLEASFAKSVPIVAFPMGKLPS